MSSHLNSDVCFVCHDRGMLICCDSCPLAFHLDCAGLTRVPKGKYQCKQCKLQQAALSNNISNNPDFDQQDTEAEILLRTQIASLDTISRALYQNLNESTAETKEIDGFTFVAYLPPVKKNESNEVKIENTTPQTVVKT